MKIITINNTQYKSNYKYKSHYSSFKGENIKRENGYVIIPEKKYKRDKLIEYGLLASLILIEIFRNFFGKPNFPKL